MLQALRPNPSRRAVIEVRPLPAPIRGWNTRDQYSETRNSQLYAPVLDNWTIASGRIETRSGFSRHATGMMTDDVVPVPATIESLMAYEGEGTQKLFAAAGSKIFDVTATAAVGAAVLTGRTSARYQSTMFATTSGTYLVAVNGADGVQTYHGVTQAWATQAITGVDPAIFESVTSYKGRLWFAARNSLKAWYLGVFNIAGAATSFDIGALCSEGGHIAAIGSWSHDGGAGPDDYLAFVTSRGQVVVYTGTDPSTASGWSLVGIYQIDEPLGRRCLVKYGADLGILTKSGVVLLSNVLASTDEKDDFSAVIGDQFTQASATASSSVDWQVAHYPSKGWVIVNVPGATENAQRQFVFSSVERAWFSFSGMRAKCWAELDGKIFFAGTTGTVYRADHGLTDDDNAIFSDVQFAWSRFGTPFRKLFKMVKPHFFSDNRPSPSVSIGVDYDGAIPTTLLTTAIPPAKATWDISAWDEDEWGGSWLPYANWGTVRGEGSVGSPKIRVSTSNARLGLAGLEVAFEISKGM